MRYIDRKVLTDKLRAMFGTDYELEVGDLIDGVSAYAQHRRRTEKIPTCLPPHASSPK